MRHGQASFDAQTDEDRSLDSIGCAQVESASRMVTFEADRILVSPYLRAKQTLVIFNKTRQISVEQTQLITPEANIEALIDHLTMRQEQSLMIIAHNPLLSYLANALTFEDRYAFNTASIVHLQGEVIAMGCMSLVKEYHQY